MICESKSKKSEITFKCESVNGQFPTFLEMLPPGGPPDNSKLFADRCNQDNDDVDEGGDDADVGDYDNHVDIDDDEGGSEF